MKQSLYCQIRKTFVKNLPEEQVRQAFISFLCKEKQVPLDLIGIELSLSSIPHLAHRKKELPLRRADLLVFAKNHPVSLFPFILVECKATPFSEKMKRQIIGYNLFVQSNFLILVNQTEVLWKGIQDRSFFSTPLPSYPELLEKVFP